jgi:hypothetical protein
MKLLKIFLVAMLTLFSISAAQPPVGDVSVVDAGLTLAQAGLNGWYVSDVNIYAVSPVVANGKYLRPGSKLTISNEGEQEIEFVTPDGQITAIQFVRIDKTPPTVTWVSPINTEVTASYSDLQAEISDAVSGVCRVEMSTDHGSSWVEGWNAASFALDEMVRETTWTYHPGFPEFAEGSQVVILRAIDCAGNISAGEILVVKRVYR